MVYMFDPPVAGEFLGLFITTLHWTLFTAGQRRGRDVRGPRPRGDGMGANPYGVGNSPQVALLTLFYSQYGVCMQPC